MGKRRVKKEHTICRFFFFFLFIGPDEIRKRKWSQLTFQAVIVPFCGNLGATAIIRQIIKRHL